MSYYPTSLRTLLRLTVLLCCALNATAIDKNVTVADTDPSISYQPPSSWHSSTNLANCPSCLNPPSLSTTFHEGINAPTPAETKEQEHKEHEQQEAKEKAEKKKAGESRSLSRRFALIARDGDDNPPDVDVKIVFNFTGSAIYVLGVIPPSGVLNVNSTSPKIDVTFTIDGVKADQKPLAPSRLEVFAVDQTVFSQVGLHEGPHQLVMSLAPNSTFIFQSLIYTHDIAEASGVAAPTPSSTSSPQDPSSPSASTQSSPSQTTESENSKHNVATFAGAVGGGVGVLALFSFGLALSIFIRRRRSIRRDRQDHESLHTNASDDSPAMSGPAPFVPRYFPDTVIPTEPPTYHTALAASNGHSTLLSRLTPAALMATPTEEDEEDRSYANVPPPMPPPPVEDIAALLLHPPPPPFPEAPPPPPPGIFIQRPEGAHLPHTLPGGAAPAYESNERASVAGDVGGIEPLPSILPPEQVPLLQAVDASEPIAPAVPVIRIPTPAPTSSSSSSMYVREPSELPESSTTPRASEPAQVTAHRVDDS